MRRRASPPAGKGVSGFRRNGLSEENMGSEGAAKQVSKRLEWMHVTLSDVNHTQLYSFPPQA